MDTQGTNDTQTAAEVNFYIFSFAMMLSSVTLFNIKDTITYEDMNCLNAFAQHMKVFSSDIFQSLKFVIRDWLDEGKYPSGLDGGQQMVEQMFVKEVKSRITTNGVVLADEVVETRRLLNQFFNSLTGCLLPWPGHEIAVLSKVKILKEIKTKNIDGNFKHCVDELCRDLFVDNIVIRSTAWLTWKRQTFFDFFLSLEDGYETGILKFPGTFREVAAKNVALVASSIAENDYMAAIEQMILDERVRTMMSYVSQEYLDEKHQLCLERVVFEFNEKLLPFGKFKSIERYFNRKIG